MEKYADLAYQKLPGVSGHGRVPESSTVFGWLQKMRSIQEVFLPGSKCFQIRNIGRI